MSYKSSHIDLPHTSSSFIFHSNLTAIECPSLPDPENGRVTLSGNTLGSSATYSCDNGFGLVGKSIRLCLADGTWSEKEPTCESKFS